jgi:uncharacterized damage-inducible protein DinB
MHQQLETVLSYLDSRRAALTEAVELVPTDLRDERPGADRWSVALVLEHLVIIEKRIAMGMTKWIGDARAGGLGTETDSSAVLTSMSVDAIADRTRRVNAPGEVVPNGNMDAATAWTALEKSRAALRTAAVSGDGLALSQVFQPHPIFGPINIYQWLLFVGAHEERHTGQVREIAQELKAAPGTATAAS